MWKNNCWQIPSWKGGLNRIMIIKNNNNSCKMTTTLLVDETTAGGQRHMKKLAGRHVVHHHKWIVFICLFFAKLTTVYNFFFTFPLSLHFLSIKCPFLNHFFCSQLRRVILDNNNYFSFYRPNTQLSGALFPKLL